MFVTVGSDLSLIPYIKLSRVLNFPIFFPSPMWQWLLGRASSLDLETSITSRKQTIPKQLQSWRKKTLQEINKQIPKQSHRQKTSHRTTSRPKNWNKPSNLETPTPKITPHTKNPEHPKLHVEKSTKTFIFRRYFGLYFQGQTVETNKVLLHALLLRLHLQHWNRLQHTMMEHRQLSQCLLSHDIVSVQNEQKTSFFFFDKQRRKHKQDSKEQHSTPYIICNQRAKDLFKPLKQCRSHLSKVKTHVGSHIRSQTDMSTHI